MVYGVRVFERDEVQPAATAGAAGRGTEFVAEGLECVAGGVVEFGGEGTAADALGVWLLAGGKGMGSCVLGDVPCSVCFHDADYFFDLEGVDAETGDGSAG